MTQVKPTLVIICGLPGAGKTTLAKQLAQEMPAIRFCPDEWMEELGVSLWDEKFRDKLEKRFWKQTQELLMLNTNVILEYGFWAKAERDEKLHGARSLGAYVELHYLDVPYDELRRRLEKRGMEGDDKIVSSKLKEYSSSFERPDEKELKMYDNHSGSKTVA